MRGYNKINVFQAGKKMINDTDSSPRTAFSSEFWHREAKNPT